MGLQYDNPNPLGNDSPRTQRMTADEARSVIALWQQERVEQTGLTDRPAVPDVAEGLDIPVEEVQRLLAEVRARRLEEERALAQEQELSEIRLAEEERRLAEIQRQRAELRQTRTRGQKRTASHQRWIETKPGVWEDVSQQEPPLVKVGMVVACFFLISIISVFVYAVWILSSMPSN